jgi:transposase-like protein
LGFGKSRSGFFSLNLRNKFSLRLDASFRVGIRSSGPFDFFGGLLAMTLTDLNQMFSTDEQCRSLLARLRWPFGVECLRCKSKKVFDLPTQKKYECGECGYQFSVTTQTIFHDTHLPMETWFMAVLLIVEARKGMSANQVKRTLGISYKTAWYLCHRIRAAMCELDQPMLDGTVEMDETYVGGKQIGKGVWYGKKSKEVVIGIRQRSGDLRFFHAEDAKSGTLARFIEENISQDVEVLVTDEFSSYPFAMKRAGVPSEKHKTVQHKAHQYVDGDIHTNTVESAFSLLKRGIIGSWHRISAKHLQAYLDEMQFRFNRRKNPNLFLDTLRHMVTADPLTFERLTA